MTDEKICPFMSRPVSLDSVSNSTLTQNNWALFEVVCIRERCKAWDKHVKIVYNDDGEGDFETVVGCRLIP